MNADTPHTVSVRRRDAVLAALRAKELDRKRLTAWRCDCCIAHEPDGSLSVHAEHLRHAHAVTANCTTVAEAADALRRYIRRHYTKRITRADEAEIKGFAVALQMLTGTVTS
jgi:hypothetical protein